MKFAWTAKGSPFGRAGIEQSEMTKRASPLLLSLFLLTAAHGVLDEAQEGIAIAGGFLFAHTADVE